MASALAGRIASQAAAAAGSAGVVSMPVPETASWRAVGPFGLVGALGERRLRRSLEIEPHPDQALDLLAMCAGEVVRVSAGYPIGPGRTRQGASIVTRYPGLLLTVSPVGPILATLALSIGKGSGAAGVLELPEPTWIVYQHEGELTLDPALEQVAIWDVLDGIPEGFPPGEIDSDESDPTAPDPEPADLDLLDPDVIVSPYVDLPGDVRAGFDRTLGAVADRLALDPLVLEVVIEGHTDSRDSESSNVALSVRRAKMIRRRLVQLILQRASDLTWDDWMAILRPEGRGEGDRWFVHDVTEPQRAANRRVEIKAHLPIKVQAGQRLGSVRRAPGTGLDSGTDPDSGTGLATVTVLDKRGRVLDPLDLVRRYDVHQEFPQHPLGIFRDPTAPAIASGWVHVVSPDPAADGAIEHEQPFFRFPNVELPGDNPLAAVLDGPEPVEPGDIIWIVDQNPGSPTIPTQITIDRPITIVSGGASLTGRAPYDGAAHLGPVIHIESPIDADGLGVRLLGLNLAGARSVADGGGAVRISAAKNVHIASCRFAFNEVSAVAGEGGADLIATETGPGGAVYLESCGRVLIEDCTFSDNKARNGGALCAEDCDGVAVIGRPLEPGVETAYQGLLADPDAAVPSDPSLNPLAGAPYWTVFQRNRAQETGGALLFLHTPFRIEYCAFTGNTAKGFGGALAAVADEPKRVDPARSDIAARMTTPDVADNVIAHCLARDNHAPGGGAFALGGPAMDPTALVSEEAEALAEDAAAVVALGPILGPVALLATAADRPAAQPASGLVLVAGNLVVENSTHVPSQPLVSGLGGGLYLASGVFYLKGNRIAQNRASGYGGGVACLANARADLRSNVLHLNLATNPPNDAPEDIGVPGGAAIYAHGFGGEAGANPAVPPTGSLSRADRTVVRLFGNTLRENNSFRDGGAILATCGALVVSGGYSSERLADIEPNVFQANNASWNGGAISIRNADLEIWDGDSFADNRAARDGGALFVGGTIVYLEPTVAKLSHDVARPGTSTLASARGARLIVSRSSDDSPSVTFTGNRAHSLETSHGGAIFLAQQPVVPHLGGGNFSIGLLRSVLIEHAQFAGNWSDGPIEGLPGSTIATLGLDHRWRDEYSGSDALSARNEILRDEPLGPYTLTPLDIEVNQGLGLLLLNSEAPDVTVSVGLALVRDSAGRPAGEGWAPEMRRPNVVRPMEP